MAGAIPGDPDWAGGIVFRDVRDVEVDVPDSALYKAACRVGGGPGWYAADALWQICGWLDRLVGVQVCGVAGMTRTRFHTERLSTSSGLLGLNKIGVWHCGRK